jgi:hypothetical protein
MASGDASAFGRKNVAYRITFPIYDADGDLVTGATGLDSEVSKDGGTFTDCTNEATEIATSSGLYYLDLTSTEMNADTVAVIVKTSSSGAKTTALVIYPLKDGDLTANVTQIAGQTASAAGAVAFPGTIASTTNITGGTITTVTTVTNRVSANTDQWNGVTVTGMPLPTSSYTSPPTAATIADAVWDEASGDHLAAGSTGASLNAAGSAGDPWTTTLPGTYSGSQAGKILSDILVDTGTTLQGELDGIQADTEDIQSRLPAALVSGRMDSSVGAMAANVLTASALATDAVSEIQSGLATTANVAAVETDTQDIQARLPATLVSGRIDAAVGAMASGVLTAAALATDAVGEIADGVWDEPYSGHTTAGTYGGRIPRSLNSNVEVQITGSGHIAADIHELQPAVINNTHFAAGAIDSNALAASAASEIATAAYTGQMMESYRAAGVAPTLAQAMFELLAHMGDASISGTTKTLKKIDGTTAKTFTLDSSTAPTSITEAT